MRGTGVGVNAGLMGTGWVPEGLQTEAALLGIGADEAQAQAEPGIPLGRTAEPEEVAATVVFLASTRPRYVTDATVTMDGAKAASMV